MSVEEQPQHSLSGTNSSEELFQIPHPRKSIYGIALATFFLRVAFGSTTVLMPLYIYYHLKLQQKMFYITVIIVEVMYSIGVILSSSFFGFRADEDDAKKWILFGTAAGGVILLGYGICALNWEGIIGIIPLVNGLLIFGMSLFHFLHGISAACKINSSYAYLSRYSVYETRARKMGVYNAAVFTGRAVGVALAGYFYVVFVGKTEITGSSPNWIPTRPFHLVYVYLIFAFFLLISAFVVYCLVDKAKPVEKSQYKFDYWKELKESWKIMTNKERRSIILPLLGTASVIGILNNWGYIVLAVDTAPDTASYMTIIVTLIMGVPMALWGYVADKFGRKKTLILGVIGILGMVTTLFLAYFLNYMPMDDPAKVFSYPLFTTLLVVFVILTSAYAPSISGRLGDSSTIGFKTERHGSTMSVQQTIVSLSEILGIILGGLALLISYLIVGWGFSTNIIALLIPTAALILLTALSTFLWPSEEEFVKKHRIRTKKVGKVDE
ncbi:MAG: MFS transporter [Candidatus Heimdallarchaeaceae archaeon]